MVVSHQVQYSAGVVQVTIIVGPPTKREIMKKLGKATKIPCENGEHCPICLLNYKKGELMRTLPSCKHYFHKKCVDKWLWRSDEATCPICRVSYAEVLDN